MQITPEIDIDDGVTVGGTPIATGGTVDFSNVNKSQSLSKTFTISNSGNADLTLNASPVSLSGTNAGFFSVTQPSNLTIVAGGSITYTITYSPTALGSHSALITIASNDLNESSFLVNISGTGTQPVMAVKYGATSIANNSTYDIGYWQKKTTGNSLVFTIENSGDGVLSLNGSPDIVAISGPDAAEFSLLSVGSVSIAASASTNFSLNFDPASTGYKRVTITIPSNDATASPYVFNLETIAYDIKTPVSTGNVGYSPNSIVVGENAIYTVYYNGSNTSIDSARSFDGGATWNVFEVDPSGTDYHSPNIYFREGVLYAFYNDGSNLKMAKSVDGGASWSKSNITTANWKYESTSYAVCGSQINISYKISGNLYYAYSTDWGTTWSAILIGAANTDYNTSITCSGFEIFISYLSNTNGDLKLAKSTNTGLSWSTSTVDPTGDTGYRSSIFYDGTKLYISYIDYTNSDIKLAISTNQGITWDIKTVATNSSSRSNGTRILLKNSTLYVAYYRSGQNLGLAKSGDNGTTWNLSTLDSPGNTGFSPFITSRGDNIYISYQDVTNSNLKLIILADNRDYHATNPEITISNAGIDYKNTTGNHYFGHIVKSNSSAATTFKIENRGGSNLTITSAPALVNLGGTDSSQFSITQPASGTIAAGGNQTFTVTFSPTAPGYKTATLTINSNDADEAATVINLGGFGAAPVLELEYNGTSIANIGTFDFEYTTLAHANTQKSFTVRNTGTSDLTLSGSYITITGTDSADFVFNSISKTKINSVETLSFTLNFDATATSIGAKSATGTITSDDPVNGSYVFNIIGGWFNPVNVDGGNGHILGSEDNSLCMINNNLYIGYKNKTNADVVMANSTDSGNTWSFNNLISSNTFSVLSSHLDLLCPNSTDLLLIYSISGDGRLHFIKSTNNGSTWGSTVEINGSYGNGINSLYNEGVNYYIAGDTYNALVIYKSTDSGVSFDVGTTIDSIKVKDISIIGTGNNIFIVYYDYTNYNLKFAKSTNSGGTWSTQIIESTGNIGGNPDIVLDGSKIYIPYQDITNTDLKFAFSSDAGVSWTTSLIHVTSSGLSGKTSLVMDGNVLYMAYGITLGLRVAKSTDGGNTWKVHWPITDDTNNASLKMDSNWLYISYIDDTVDYLKFIKLPRYNE